MNCPFCNHVETKVLDSRPDAEGKSIRRRRECLSCSKRWRTLERVEDEMPLVMKKDGTFQSFDRNKILHSMIVATGKRPVSRQQIDTAVAGIEWSVLESGADSVTSNELGEKVMTALKKLDEISYVRFASVYRRFRDVGELMAEMKDLLTEGRQGSELPKSS